MKIKRIRASIIATLSFFIENIYTRYIALLAQWYTNLFVTWRSSSPTSVCPLRLIVLCIVPPDLFVIYYCLFIFSSTGGRPASLCHGLLSVVRPSIRALTFSLNIFFAETTYRILMKFHRNVTTMVLFRISWNNLIPSKTLVAMATKLKILKSLKIFLSETIRPRATKFGM